MASLDLVNPYLFRYRKRNFLVKGKLKRKDLDGLQHVDIRPSDIVLITYPKSGTIWMQQIVVNIIDCTHPDLVEDATNRIRVPWLEERVMDDHLRERPDPRIFRTHLPPDMLPHGVKAKKIKVVYIIRNPKDVLVSLYHFSASWIMLETPQSFEDFFQQFLDGNDLADEQIDHVAEMSTFTNMKTNPKANYKDLVEIDRYSGATMHKGITGDWKNYFTEAQNEHFDQFFNEKMNDLPLSLIWEIKQ
ncbi:hypothetical protein LDENG_00004320 [Lucifuga dentata]|nr:hypothetical protein LDENG_00004320 [Lucifuga dentata]